ncbi:hypothetical protein [Lactiplantibacillus plantarum]|uniref:hypothetical protein n=1 Tax=Lactiplantibacillus plantarum TaxID=1590 RepID=UPI000FF5DE60|nr:hypothetical protein [Lactiplantibacillus plantarum]QAS29524.1 hypothetical protein EQK45_05810 [Lactiplantibacillus plantarum]QBA77637.1 hypothetical protein EVE91_09680 [Lactiplantibacillus plantarum]RWZ47702.1 hypothetical protein EQJ06_05780 [Lactiplantibacillus plantarum]RWZ70953.1 hypothetical protein EQH87_09700 [Lactiplantibacillus plantarum]
MKKIVKQYWWGLLLGFLAIIIIPVILQWMMISIFNNTSGGSDDGWLGFWGGYLGAIITVPTTVFVTIWSILKQIKESKSQFERQIDESKNQFEEKRRINNLSELLSIIISFRDDTNILIAHLNANKELKGIKRRRAYTNNKHRLNQLFNVRFLEFQRDFNTKSVLLSPEDINRKDFLPIKKAITCCVKHYVSQNKIDPIIYGLEEVVTSIDELIEITQKRI